MTNNQKPTISIKRPRVIHFRDKCIGCGNCVQEDSSNWDISLQDGKAFLQGGQNKGKEIYAKNLRLDEVEKNKKAQKNCPVKIIRVEE